MAVTLGSNLSAHQQQDLETHLRKVWALGANLVIAWRMQPYGLEVYYLPSFDLPKVSGIEAELLQSDRQINSEKEIGTLMKAGCKVLISMN